MQNPDPLVAALAAERDFLCQYIERQSSPPPKHNCKSYASSLDPPTHSLVLLRFLFKTLSQRLKKNSARIDADLLLVRAWYSDSMLIAHSFVQQYFLEQAAKAWSLAPSQSTAGVCVNDAATTDSETYLNTGFNPSAV